MNWMRKPRWAALVLVAVLVSAAPLCWGLGQKLSETKDELKLKYDIAIEDHGNGRVNIVFTLADEGRLKPIEEIELFVPSKERGKDGRPLMDLAMSLDLVRTKGKWVGHVYLLNDFAERAEIQLNTHTLDGNLEPTTRLHYVIPIAKYMKPAPATAPAVAPVPSPAHR